MMSNGSVAMKPMLLDKLILNFQAELHHRKQFLSLWKPLYFCLIQNVLNFRHVVEINVKDDPPYYYVKTSETFMLGILLMVPILSLRIRELVA